jgi:hypothetical protein
LVSQVFFFVTPINQEWNGTDPILIRRDISRIRVKLNTQDKIRSADAMD